MGVNVLFACVHISYAVMCDQGVCEVCVMTCRI